MNPSSDPKVRAFHNRSFCLRPGDAPYIDRASGDSGFVAHLVHCTRGATGWDWSFRLTKKGEGWSFGSDGRVSLFLDEQGQYVPNDAKIGDLIAIRLPRARENLFPSRFTLYGGQGGCVIGQSGFVKLFMPVTYEAAPGLIETCASKLGDQLRFTLSVINTPNDYQRVDTAVLDFAADQESGIEKMIEAFVRANPKGVTSNTGLPYGCTQGLLGFAQADGGPRSDLADGFGWRKAREAVRR